MKKLYVLTALAALVLARGHAQAQSQFDFTFSGQQQVYNYSTSTYDLTGPEEVVSGVITLNAAQNAATSVVLTSMPFAIADKPLNFDWVTGGNYVDNNSFTVTGGNISAVLFDSVDLNTFDDLFFESGEDLLSNGSSGDESLNLDPGFSGLTFTPVVAPEPTTLALAGLGGSCLLLFRKRK